MSIIIASNYKIVVESLWHLLKEAGFNVCGSADSLYMASHEITSRHCDAIILTDPAFSLPTDLVLQRLQSISDGVPVVLVSLVEKIYLPSMSLENSLRSILPKESQVSDLCKAVRSALEGKFYIMPAVAELLVQSDTQLRQKKLSFRELQVLCLIAKGMSISEIAKNLFLSVKTVSSHKSNIKHRLSLQTTGHIIRYAIERGLVPVSAKVTKNGSGWK